MITYLAAAFVNVINIVEAMCRFQACNAKL